MRRTLTVLALVALVAVAVSPAVGSNGGRDQLAPTSSAKAKKLGAKKVARTKRLARTNSAKAKKLVRRIVRAKSERRRVRATMALMRSLRVAVYTGGGKRLTRRASAARSVYLYDFEVRAVAQRFAAGDRVPLEQLAGMLGAAGLQGPDGKLPPATLASALRKTLARMTRRPRARDGLGAFAVRHLGLLGRKRFDPARKSALKHGLDPLQAQLVVAALRQHAATRGRRRARRAVAAGPVVSSSAGCGEIKKATDAPFNGGLDGVGGQVVDKVTRDQWGRVVKIQVLRKAKGRRAYRKIFNSRIGKLVTKAANRLNVAKQVGHIALLDALIKVRETQQFVGPVHYNHERTRPNAVILETEVTMLADLPEAVVKCGSLAGFEIPGKGGIPKVPITWVHPRLGDHGHIDCPEVGCNETDKHGRARLRAELNEERLPGYGLEVREIGTAHSVAHYQTAFGAFLDAGQLVEVIKPKSGTHAWGVTYHEEPALSLRFSARDDYVDNVGGDRSGTGESHYAVSSEVPVTLGGGGQGPLRWDRFSFSKRDGYTTCTGDGSRVSVDEDGISTQPGVFEVSRLIHDPASADADPMNPHAGFTLDFRLDPPPTETYEVRHTPPPGSACGPAGGTFTQDSWANLFSYMFVRSPGAQRLDLNEYVFRLTGWEHGDPPVGGEGVIARKRIQGESGSALLEVVGRPAR